MKNVEIYTDGACSGNPGKGGWAAILRYKDIEKIICGYNVFTTNNQMELTAVIEALKTIKSPCNIIVFSDSKYVCDGVNRWLALWKNNSWKNSSKKTVINLDLWQQLDVLITNLQPKFEWVKAHSNNVFNNRVDELARNQIKLI